MIVSIVGGILAVGLALLIALKIIIMILQRIEYNDFVKNKVVWGEVNEFGSKRKKWVGFGLGQIWVKWVYLVIYPFLGPKSTL